MNTDVKDTHFDTQASELLGKLLNGDIEWLSEQDKSVLTENRKAIVQHLITIFSKEIPHLIDKKGTVFLAELGQPLCVLTRAVNR